jgi:hypothetical protein
MVGMQFVPIALNSCRYQIQLVYNKKKYGIYDFQLLPLAPPSSGQISANMYWSVKITGPEKTPVTLRVVTQTSSSLAIESPEVQDEVHLYTVSCDPRTLGLVRSVERYFKRCY